MKIVKSSEVPPKTLEGKSVVKEYELDSREANIAVVRIEGRYPTEGFSCNNKSQELVYVMSGSGNLLINNEIHALEQGDAVRISSGEKFYWEGSMDIVVCCTPPWDISQYSIEK